MSAGVGVPCVGATETRVWMGSAVIKGDKPWRYVNRALYPQCDDSAIKTRAQEGVQDAEWPSNEALGLGLAAPRGEWPAT